MSAFDPKRTLRQFGPFAVFLRMPTMSWTRGLGRAMNRRELISLIACTTVGWPVVVTAQQVDKPRRVGVLMDLAENDPEGQARLAAFRSELSRLGWSGTGNPIIDVRWGAGVANRMRDYAAELVALMPDAILASGSPAVAALQQSTTKV